MIWSKGWHDNFPAQPWRMRPEHHWLSCSLGPAWLVFASEFFERSAGMEGRRGYLQPMKLAVLVHPGSLCGPYHMEDGDNARLERLAQEFLAFSSVRVRVDGDFMDEVSRYPIVRALCETCQLVYRAAADGKALRTVARSIARDLGRRDTVLVTGAWADEASGCVTAVAEGLRHFCRARVLISVHAPRFLRPEP